MRPAYKNIRNYLIPSTLALIFGAVLFHAYNASSAGSSMLVPMISVSKAVDQATAAPGATLMYNVTITNMGSTATTGVMFSDTIDANTTLVPGSINTSPLAINDSYSSVGNVGINVPVGNGLLANDFDPDGTLPAITAAPSTTAQGGSLNVLASGAFTYNPPPGFEGIDTFNYTISDGLKTDTGSVAINVSGMIWFINNNATPCTTVASGCGRLSNPLSSLAAFNSANTGGGSNPDINDNIFIFESNTQYAGGVTLLSGQKLIGQDSGASLALISGVSLPPFSNALPAMNTGNPTVDIGSTVTLNTNTTVRGLSINSSTSTGMNDPGIAISGVNVSEVNVNSTTGTAILFSDLGGTLSFIKISANGGSNGISLTNTTGSFTVNGDGTNTSLGGNGSGGTISNMNGADGLSAGNAIYLNNAQNVTLRRMTINGTNQNHGIRGFSVNNFTLQYSKVEGINGNSAGGIGEGSVYFGNDSTINGLTGTANITGCTISGGRSDNFRIYNNSGSLNRITISNSTFGHTQSGALPASNDSLGLSARNNGTVLNATVSNCTFTGSPGDLFDFTGQTGTSMDLVFQNNTLSNDHPNNTIGGGGVSLQTQGSMTFNFSSNSLRGANGSALTLFKATAGTNLSGTINNNSIGVTGFAGSGSATGNGIFLSAAGSGNITLAITNNQIRNYNGNAGIYADNTGGSYSVNFNISGNTVAEPGGGAFAALAITNGSPMSSDTIDVCASITGNDFSTGDPSDANDIVVAASGAGSGHMFRLPGYLGSTLSDVQNFIKGNNLNPGSTAVLAYADSPATDASFVGGPACAAPSTFAPDNNNLAAPDDSTDNQAQLNGGMASKNVFSRARQWLAPVFAAFSAPTNLSLPNLFTAHAAEAPADRQISPSANKAAMLVATGASMSGENVTRTIAQIPPGKTVTIMFSVTINSPFPAGVCTVANQGAVSGSGFSTVLTDDPNVGGAANPTVTTVLVPPVISACPTNITTNTDPGLCTAAVTFATPGGTGCPTPSVTCSPASGSAFPKGTTTVTCTATNTAGSDSCSFTVTVNDNQGPALAGCPTNIVKNTDPGLCTAAVSFIPPTATDACDGARPVTCTPASGSTFAKGTTTVTCSASDTLGNASSCSFSVTVNDNQGPVLTGCPTNITTNTDAGLCTATVTFATPTANDVCDGSRTVACSPASGSTFAKGTTTVTCSSSDSIGNTSSCSFTVTVNDNQPPVVSCPSPISVTESSPGSGSATVTFSATANDVCDGSRTVTCTPASGSSFSLGTTTVNCSASDTSSNTGTCSFTVTVTQSCTISCPSNITVNNSPGQCGANVSFAAPTTTAGCGTVTCSHNSGDFFPVGTTTVSCNTSAGPSCSFTVTVNDNEAPSLTCPTSINTTTNSTTGCTATVSIVAPTAVDNCGGTTTVTGARSDGQPLNDPYPLGTTTITWTAKDSLNNASTCTQTVTVTNPDPVVSINAPASGAIFAKGTTVNFSGSFTDNPGTHTATWTFDSTNVSGSVNEMTGAVSATYIFNTPGVYQVTLSVTDNCGGSGMADTVGGLQALVVIYDPSGGFVTGGGWINSPPGAYVPDPMLTGKANFGFVSKYKKGSSVPDGNTEFQFKAANFNFKSTAYEWLVVAGARAQFKGSGKVNNAGDFRFMLTAIDGQVNGGGGLDKFRIKIWNNNGGGLVYDNQLNAPDSDDPTTVLGGGSIVIHKDNGNGSLRASKSVNDFDGDGRSDLSAWRGQQGDWLFVQSSTDSLQTRNWGADFDAQSDVEVAGDYDGDGTTDVAVFRRSNGHWYVKQSSDGQLVVRHWGQGTDIPVPADYDGDGKTDIAVWRGAEGNWYIVKSSTGSTQIESWGAGIEPYLDVPVPADFDGDGKADLAVFRRMDGTWHIRFSSDDSSVIKSCGTGSDLAKPADYDGDGKADVAVWRSSNGNWIIVQSSDDSIRTLNLGTVRLGDIPMPGDYDGDGLTDIAVWRPVDGTWRFRLSGENKSVTRYRGSSGRATVTNK